MKAIEIKAQQHLNQYGIRIESLRKVAVTAATMDHFAGYSHFGANGRSYYHIEGLGTFENLDFAIYQRSFLLNS
ncbi:hypothetical protein [Rudanella lutea]|uniref:hypothetical protein n=1 Tax=Rudanella lutea TaxID=451374 RepID=UPI00036C0420|nr:hypothetical protein [Rudanella lutea]